MDRLKRFFNEVRRDNVTGEAAKVAYYFFLSLFPLIIVLFALTGFFGGEGAFQLIMARVQAAVPAETADFLERFVRQITLQREPGALSLGLLLTLWAASGGVAALADGLNEMYDVEETRSWWKKRLVALGLLVAGAVFVVGSAAILLAGPAIGRALGLGPVWNVLRWPIAFALLSLLLALVYYVLPNRDQSRSKSRILAGAVGGALIWLGATFLFRLYVANFASYSETYGFVGAIIVLMLWLYLTALAILFGGEVAAVLEKRAMGRPAEQRQAA